MAELADLVGAFEAQLPSARGDQEAIACYLSAGEAGTRRVKALGGAFASDAAGAGLRDDKG